MQLHYTAVGHFRRKTDASGRTYPVLLVNQEEHMVDMQEMAVWSVLNWRFLRLEQVELKYSQNLQHGILLVCFQSRGSVQLHPGPHPLLRL